MSTTDLLNKEEPLGAKVLAILAVLSLPMKEYFVNGLNLNFTWVAMLLAIPFTLNIKSRNSHFTWILLGLGFFFFSMNILSILFYGNEPWFSNSSLLNNTFFLIPVAFLIISWYTGRISIKTFLRAAVFFALLASIIVIYQRISYILWGTYKANWSLNFIPGVTWGRADALKVKSRASAFFSEPAHYAGFCLPILIYLFQKRKILPTLIILSGLFASGSTNGLVGMFVCFVSVVLFDLRKGSAHKWRIFFYLVLFIMAFIGIYYIMNTYFPEIMLSQMSKVEETGSNSARFFGPLPILLNFDVLEWIFGIGLGNKSSYISSNHILLLANDEGDNYTNTLFSLLIYFGIIGFIVFMMFMYYIYKQYSKGYSISYFLLMVVLFFSTNFIIEVDLIYYLLFVINCPLIVNMEYPYKFRKLKFRFGNKSKRIKK